MSARTAGLRAPARVAEREARFFALTWKGVAFGLFGAPSLYLLALGFGLGGLVGSRDSLGGLDYLAFITPGVIVGSVAQTAGVASLWPIMAGHRWVGFHRSIVATPISSADVVTGYLGWIGAQASLQAVVVLLFGAALGGVGSPWALLAVPVAAATAGGVAAPLMAYSATCDSDRAFDPLVRLVITPLYLFSGAFFPSSALPAPVEWAQRLAPVWHGVSLARAATSGIAPDPWLGQHQTLSATVSAVVIVAWVVGGWSLARHTFTRRLTP